MLRSLKNVVTRFLLLVFFMNRFPPQPQSIPLGSFEFFRKFAEIFTSQGALPISTTLVADLPPVSRTLAAKLPWYQQHQRNICHQYQRHRQQIFRPVLLVVLIPMANLPQVSTTPAAYLSPVSTTPVANCNRNK